MGVQHERVNISKKQRVRGSYHVQTVNHLHREFRDFMICFRGVATKYLNNYLERFRMVCHNKAKTDYACLSSIMAGAVAARA